MVFVPKCIRFPNGQLLLGLAKNYEKGKCPFVFNYYNVHLQPITIIQHSKCNKNSPDSRCSKALLKSQDSGPKLQENQASMTFILRIVCQGKAENCRKQICIFK